MKYRILVMMSILVLLVPIVAIAPGTSADSFASGEEAGLSGSFSF